MFYTGSALPCHSGGEQGSGVVRHSSLDCHIMSSERPPKGRITDKIGRSVGKLSHLWRPLASSSMDPNSSSDKYIDAGYVYFNPICVMSLNHW